MGWAPIAAAEGAKLRRRWAWVRRRTRREREKHERERERERWGRGRGDASDEEGHTGWVDVTVSDAQEVVDGGWWCCGGWTKTEERENCEKQRNLRVVWVAIFWQRQWNGGGLREVNMAIYSHGCAPIVPRLNWWNWITKMGYWVILVEKWIFIWSWIFVVQENPYWVYNPLLDLLWGRNPWVGFCLWKKLRWSYGEITYCFIVSLFLFLFFFYFIFPFLSFVFSFLFFFSFLCHHQFV